VGAHAVVLADRVVALLAAVASVCIRQSVFSVLTLLRWRTLLGVRAGATHHGHRLATVAASLGHGWRVSAEWLSALGEILGGAFNFCRECISRVRSPCQKPVTAVCCHCLQPQPNMVLTPSTSNPSCDVPSNCATKALASTPGTVELAPGSMLLGVLPRL
jgi:hypothetical protein